MQIKWALSISPINYGTNSTGRNWWHHPGELMLKKSINLKPYVQIKFRLQHYFSYDKIFKIRPHLLIFAQYFKNYFLILINKFRLLGTNILTTRTNNFFLRTNNNIQRTKYYTSRTFDYNEKRISQTNQSTSRNNLIYKANK